MSMASRSAESRAREWAALERDVCAQLPAGLSRMSDRSRLGGTFWDAICSEPLVDEPELRLIGTELVGEGSLVEIKTCQEWIDDRHASAGRRRGRWTFHSRNHQQRLEHAVANALVVLDDQEVLAAAIVTADVVDELLEGRWGGTDTERGRYAQLSWLHVFDVDDHGVILRD